MNTTKNFNINKKIIAILLIIFTLLSTASPIFAASGTGTYVAAQWATYIYTEDNAGTQNGMLLRRLTNVNTGVTRTVFCAQNGVEIRTGVRETGNYYTPTSQRVKRACKIAYYGWYEPYGDYIVDGGTPSDKKERYVLTQKYIWEALGEAYGAFLDSSRQARYESFKNEIDAKINSTEARPSFDSTSIELSAGDTYTATDTNGVLANYNSIDNSVDGVRFQHNKGENTLTITVSEDCEKESVKISDATAIAWNFIKDGTQDNDTSIYFEFADDVQNQLYALHYNDPVPVAFSLKINSFGKLELSKLNTSGKLVDGAVYNVTGPNGYNQDVTVKGGKITLDKLRKGTYTIKEITAPYGYLIDTKSYNVEVNVNQTATASITNDEPTGNFTLIKKNSDKSATIQNAEYRIWNDNYDQTFKTDKDGKIEVTGLKLGKYNYQETNAPEGYLLDENVYTFELTYKDQYTKVVYASDEKTDDEPRGSIIINKKDSETGTTPQGDAELKGAVYEVYAKEDIYNKAKTKKYYSNGDLVATRTMNEKGETEDITDLPLGKYSVKEKTASKGYLLDTKEYDASILYKDQKTKVVVNKITSNEDVKKMQLHIFKTGIKIKSGLLKGIAGAEFTIKLNSDVENALAKGYTYAEIWNGLDEDGNKVNVDSKRVSEAQVIAPSYESITTDNDGNAYTQNKLPFGTYLVKETKTPTDFETAVDFTFSVTKDESEVKEVAQKVIHLMVNDEQHESYIKLVKKDAKTNKIVSLSSATFEIKAASNIVDRGTGEILYRKGDTITQKVGSTTYTSFTTNAENKVIPDNSYNSDNDGTGTTITPLTLPVGKYEINEIKIPDGFLQLDNPVTFEIKNIKNYDTDKFGDFVKEVVIKNEQPTGTLTVDKSVALREDVDTSIVDVSDLSGIEFKLTAKENIIDKADGSKIYEKGKQVGTYNLTKEGKLKVENLPMGVYELTEIKTLPGLVLNTDKFEVKFEKKDDTTKVYTVKKEIVNNTTVTEFSKTDITGDKELEGAKLTVLDKDNNIVDTWVSTSKTHKIEGLTAGNKYTLREEISPKGFVKATDIEFSVENDNKIHKVEMVDKIVEMSKVDIGGNEIEGATIQVKDKDGNVVDEWVSTKEPHIINNLVENETYILHEEISADGYVKATDVEFTVTTDKETQHVEMVDKIVLMSKVDVGGEEIEGATIQVFDKDGNVVDEWVSEKKPHQIKNLVENETYILHEEVVAEDFVKATDIEFTVTTDKETQHEKLVDKIVTVTKTDLTNGEEIEGAKLVVTDEEGNTVDEWVSEKTPHKIKNLEEGKKYTLTELTAPYGYEIAESIEFEVSKEKINECIEMKDKPILKSVQVEKVDKATGEHIKSNKFEFGIFEDSECTKLIKKAGANENEGTALFDELRYGTYYIKEIKAPLGYKLSDQVVEIVINDEGVFADGVSLEESDSVYSFVYYNSLLPSIQTGNEADYNIIINLMVLSLAGIGVGIVLLKSKKKENK
ncbi:MAG: hypothetical protein J6N78_04000 [Clostridia bacterium]|nr:hypothetical protein [Clostridia bacterium]